MGPPILSRIRHSDDSCPASRPSTSHHVDGRELAVTAVSMGNPHAVVYVDEVDAFPVETTRASPRESSGVSAAGERAFRRGARARRSADADLGAGIGNHPGVRHRGLRRVRGRGAHGTHPRHDPGPSARGRSRAGVARRQASVFMTGPATEVFSGEWPDDRADPV